MKGEVSWPLLPSILHELRFRRCGVSTSTSNDPRIHWPDIDEDISVEGMLHGTPAPSPKSRSQPVVRDAGGGTGAAHKVTRSPARKARCG